MGQELGKSCLWHFPVGPLHVYSLAPEGNWGKTELRPQASRALAKTRDRIQKQILTLHPQNGKGRVGGHSR